MAVILIQATSLVTFVTDIYHKLYRRVDSGLMVGHAFRDQGVQGWNFIADTAILLSKKVTLNYFS